MSKKITSHNNRGMLLEKIINNTIDFYIKNNIAFFEKRKLGIKFSSINNNKVENGLIYSKSTVDYYGIYKGKYISFEAKSTELDSFPLSNIKTHQHQHLLFIKYLGGWAFYIIMFKKYNEIYVIDVMEIEKINKKTISLKEIACFGFKIDIVFPGIIDFLSIYKEN